MATPTEPPEDHKIFYAKQRKVLLTLGGLELHSQPFVREPTWKSRPVQPYKVGLGAKDAPQTSRPQGARLILVHAEERTASPYICIVLRHLGAN